MSTIVAKIDLKKMERDRIFVGAKGEYLDVVLIPTQNDKFGNDYMVVQSVTKEEREQGVKGPILGNAKILGGSARQSNAAPRQQASKPQHAKPASPWED